MFLVNTDPSICVDSAVVTAVVYYEYGCFGAIHAYICPYVYRVLLLLCALLYCCCC